MHSKSAKDVHSFNAESQKIVEFRSAEGRIEPNQPGLVSGGEDSPFHSLLGASAYGYQHPAHQRSVLSPYEAEQRKTKRISRESTKSHTTK